jgi:two-component system LytT family response regulator
MQVKMFITHSIYFMEKTIILETKDSHLIIKPSDIIRIEANDAGSELHMQDGRKLEFHTDLDFWKTKLTDYPFIKVHDRHLVNLHAIDSYDLVDHSLVTLSNGERISVQENYKIMLNEFFNRFLKT